MRLVTSPNVNPEEKAETQQQMKAAQQLQHRSALEKLGAIDFFGSAFRLFQGCGCVGVPVLELLNQGSAAARMIFKAYNS